MTKWSCWSSIKNLSRPVWNCKLSSTSSVTHSTVPDGDRNQFTVSSYQLDSILSNDLRGDDITSWAIWTQLLPMQYSRYFSGHSCQHGMHTTVGIWPGRTQHSPIRAAIIPTSHSYGRADYDDYDCLKYTRRTKKEREPADSTNRRMVAPESVVESVPSNKYIKERHR